MALGPRDTRERDVPAEDLQQQDVQTEGFHGGPG